MSFLLSSSVAGFSSRETSVCCSIFRNAGSRSKLGGAEDLAAHRILSARVESALPATWLEGLGSGTDTLLDTFACQLNTKAPLTALCCA